MSSLYITNSYGLFAVMTTTRPEIIVEGSNDGINWLPYEFPYKAGDVNRMPAYVAPYQPRLDWQMWFAALTATTSSNSWFVSFRLSAAARLAGRAGAAGEQSVPGRAAHVHPRRTVPVSLHDFGGAQRNRRVVDARIGQRLSAAGVAGQL